MRRILGGAVAVGWMASACLATACGGRSMGPGPEPEGATSPEQAVERFLTAATDAQKARRSGQMTLAEQQYDRMALVFGTEDGSILRQEDATVVRDRMIALAGLLDPRAFRVQPSVDARSREAGRTTITVEVNHRGTVRVVPFIVLRGRDNRWFIERIDMRSISG